MSPQLVYGILVSLWAFNVSVEPSVSLRALSKCRPSMSLLIFSELLASSESVGPLNLWTLVILWALSESVGLQ